MIMHLCQSVAASAQDRLWHKADIPTALSNVCFWGIDGVIGRQLVDS